jgi:capsular exopolysaccharide synthesis family protein
VPIRPKVLQNTAIGALVGLGLALALIVIFEWIDDRPASPEEVQELLGMGVLAVIPQLSRKQLTKKAEEIPGYAEAYRILSANLNIAQAIEPFKLVMITSAHTAEGKSTVVSNLASFLVMTGKRVLLVDANSRSPALDAHYQLKQDLAPPSALMERWAWIEEKLDSQLTQTAIPNLHVVTAASLGPDFTNLLQSPWANQFFDHFKKAPFDYVIFDTPPLLPVADAQILASYVEAIVVVVDTAKVSRKVLLRVKRMLNRTRNTIQGAVINRSRWAENEEIRRYLSDVQQRRADIATSLTTPHRATAKAQSPETPTPPVNDVDITTLLTTPHRATAKAQSPETPTPPVNDADITTILTILPHRATAKARPPEAPSANGKVDPGDKTIVVNRKLRFKDDQS